MPDFSALTLGECLSNPDETIRRNATSILKRFQRKFAYLLRTWRCKNPLCRLEFDGMETPDHCPICKGNVKLI